MRTENRDRLAKETMLDPGAFIFAAVSGLAIAALFLSGKGSLLRVAIPSAAFLVALRLYFRRPGGYLEFTLWTWLLTPLVRRVVDWRVGFADQNLILIAPLLVSGISILDLRARQALKRIRIAPFILCGSAIAYGFVVGMAMHPSAEVIYSLVNWLSPLLLGLHVYMNWEDVETNVAVIQRVALWGLFAISAYGIYQFFKPPAWDTMWLENLPGGLESSTFGRPESQQIRVWSTLNAPGPFATVSVALLFLLIPRRSRLKLPTLAAGLYAIMLSLVRTAWLTGAVGMLWFAMRSNRRLLMKVVFFLAAILIAVTFLANSSVQIPALQDRIKTLGDLKNDESVKDRTRLYANLTGELLELPVGVGLNNADFYHGYPLDSGPIRMLLNLGWLGTLLYFIGVGQIAYALLFRTGIRSPVLNASGTVVITFLLQLFSGLVFISSSGAFFWLAAGLGLACRRQLAGAEDTSSKTELAPKSIPDAWRSGPLRGALYIQKEG